MKMHPNYRAPTTFKVKAVHPKPIRVFLPLTLISQIFFSDKPQNAKGCRFDHRNSKWNEAFNTHKKDSQC